MYFDICKGTIARRVSQEKVSKENSAETSYSKDEGMILNFLGT